MKQPNEADTLRRQVLALVSGAIMDEDYDAIDRIAIKLRPRGGKVSRCCIYKDRAAIRYRCMAALGFRTEDETDEIRPLSDYAREAVSRFDKGIKPSKPFLTVMTIGCSACWESQTIVTNLCRGCFARPCTVACKRKAISIHQGRAIINRELCVNCGLCTQVCAFKAIVTMPLSCHDACPVDAVKKDDAGHVVIDHERCINCGKCSVGCPFSAIMERSELVDVLTSLKRKRRPVIAMPAPALAGIFAGSMQQLCTGLKQLGFDDVYDVSAGAELTSENEAAEHAERMAAGEPFMMTSCCPAWTEAVKLHIPEIAPYVSHTATPMQYTADLVRRDYPDAITVFIGPCMAKRVEALRDSRVDYVLTADELAAFFMAKDIDLQTLEPSAPHCTGGAPGRGFPVAGGVASAVGTYLKTPETLKPLSLQNIDPKLIKLIKSFARLKKAQGANLVEIMFCDGGCVGGPGSFTPTDKAAKKVQNSLED